MTLNQRMLFNLFLFFGGATLTILGLGWLAGLGISLLIFFARSEA